MKIIAPIAVIISLAVGYFNPVVKYYIVLDDSPKREISRMRFLKLGEELTKIEKSFNIELAAIVLVLIISISYLFVNIMKQYKARKIRKEEPEASKKTKEEFYKEKQAFDERQMKRALDALKRK